MGVPKGFMSPQGPERHSLERLKLRLAVLGILVVAAFVALFSRLWFLQVLAADDFSQLAKENRVRLLYSEPDRGRILDRNGFVLVDNRLSTSVTVDREIVETPVKKRAVFRRLSLLLDIPEDELDDRLNDVRVSPYKPVAVAHDVPIQVVAQIRHSPERYLGVAVEERPVRFYPQGPWAAQILGYVGEITDTQFKQPYFKNAQPDYQPGDIVGRAGIELSYDHELRGRPEIRQVVVNSSSKVVGGHRLQEAEPGKDLITTLDIRIQQIAERALESAINANRAVDYRASDAAAVVLDPNTGGVVAMASYPTYDPAILADGLQTREFEQELGAATDAPEDDRLINRGMSAAYSPGSTFKLATAMAALGLDVADINELIACPGYVELGLNEQRFNNWTSVDFGSIGFARSMEISCDTFYYELGWRMEERWGAGNGDGTERFQELLRDIGFDKPTGIDLPGEIGGTIPDEKWLEELCAARPTLEGCAFGWLPGYTVNMSIGQGEVLTTPLQMAVNYASAVNGGRLMRPHVADYFGKPEVELATQVELPSPEPLAELTASASPSVSPSSSATPTPSPSPSPSASASPAFQDRVSLGDESVVRRIKPKVLGRVPLSEEELAELREGLEDVVSGPDGTGASAFAGFPLDRFQVAGKTGTAEIGESDDNRAWFVSYAPADAPQYVIAVYMNYAGHGGESAAPIARQIYEGIFGLNDDTEDVTLGHDESD